MISQTKSIEDQWREVRRVKNELIKASKILLHTLETQKEETKGDTTSLDEQIICITQRISYLEEEVMNDFKNKNDFAATSAGIILTNALNELRSQFEKEKKIFDESGENADKLLDMHFRIQEIENSLKRKS